ADVVAWTKSFSNSSIASNRAAAIASSFCRSVPLSDTVATARRMLARRSVADLRDLAELLGRRGRKAEELEVRRDHLEQHVGAGLDRAAAHARRGEQRRDLARHHDLADERLWRDPLDV